MLFMYLMCVFYGSESQKSPISGLEHSFSDTFQIKIKDDVGTVLGNCISPQAVLLKLEFNL